MDHNGWRPISERILVEEDPVTTMTKLKRVPFFHHNPVVRREEKARRVKQRKREWMAKMYKVGLESSLVQSSTKPLTFLGRSARWFGIECVCLGRASAIGDVEL